MKKILFYKLIVLLIISFFSHSSVLYSQELYTGFRASRLLGNYPNHHFPEPAYWSSVGVQMSEKFANSTPVGIWIVGLYQDNGYCSLSFPNPTGNTYDSIYFSSYDKDEAYLQHFDTTGIHVFLQVESGAAEVGDLMDIVLGHYGNHPCVIGFGVDVEWYRANLFPEGKAVSDSLAAAWEAKVKTFNPAFQLFLKHYTTNRMPPGYRGDILFVDDSQDFNFSNCPLCTMTDEYGQWAAHFAPASSAFQFGYPADQSWWQEYEDPPATIGQSLLDNIPDCSGLFWVDFTITDIFPLGIPAHKLLSSGFRVFPNPVKNRLYTKNSMFAAGKLQWQITDSNGETIYRGEQSQPAFSIDVSQLISGTYILVLQYDGKMEKHVFVKL